MKIGLSPADRKLLDDVMDPDMVTDRSPHIKSYLEGVAEMSRMHQDITTRGRFTGQAGFSPKDQSLGLQKVAHIPLEIAETLLLVDPDILTDKKKFYAWLTKTTMGRACDYRRKVVPRAM